MLLRASEEQESDNKESVGNSIKAGEAKKKEGFEVGIVSLHYPQELGSIMSINLSSKAHHLKFYKESVTIREKRYRAGMCYLM